MSSAPPFRPNVPDGREIVDELPSRVDLLPGEADLVATYLLDALDALLAGKVPEKTI